jgi:hypothetical protein
LIGDTAYPVTAHSKDKKMDYLNVMQIGILSSLQHECVLNEHLAY